MKTKTLKIIVVISATLLFLAVIIGVLLFNGIIWFVCPEHKGFNVKGIDVSRYQGEINWQEISLQDIKFSFIKATEGTSYVDPKFNENAVSSISNGIHAGAYHFFSAESPGETQAENFIEAILPYSFDLPPVLDFEISKSVSDKENVIREALVFLQEIENQFKVKPLIYTTYESYNNFLTIDFDEYPLWFRDLLKEPKINGNRDWVFWQYCNRGRLKGFDRKQKYVDLNVFNGTEEEFETYIKENYNE